MTAMPVTRPVLTARQSEKHCRAEYRIVYSVDVVMYIYCLKILSEYRYVTVLLKPLPRYRTFQIVRMPAAGVLDCCRP